MCKNCRQIATQKNILVAKCRKCGDLVFRWSLIKTVIVNKLGARRIFHILRVIKRVLTPAHKRGVRPIHVEKPKVVVTEVMPALLSDYDFGQSTKQSMVTQCEKFVQSIQT